MPIWITIYFCSIVAAFVAGGSTVWHYQGISALKAQNARMIATIRKIEQVTGEVARVDDNGAEIERTNQEIIDAILAKHSKPPEPIKKPIGGEDKPPVSDDPECVPFDLMRDIGRLK